MLRFARGVADVRCGVVVRRRAAVARKANIVGLFLTMGFDG
jgi:hypothetical protein